MDDYTKMQIRENVKIALGFTFVVIGGMIFLSGIIVPLVTIGYYGAWGILGLIWTPIAMFIGSFLIGICLNIDV